MTSGARQAATQDLEFAVRQLVEIALRALSPGINDPFTAVTVLDRLGAELCELAPHHLTSRTIERGGRVVLYRQVTDYAGLCDAMFHMIRQSASGSPAVLIRLLETLGRVIAVETSAERRAELLRHSKLALSAGRLGIEDPANITALEARSVAEQGAAVAPKDARRWCRRKKWRSGFRPLRPSPPRDLQVPSLPGTRAAPLGATPHPSQT